MSGQCKASLDQLFDLFLAARSQEDVLSIFEDIKLQVSPLGHKKSIDIYHHLKCHLTSWRAASIWKILDERVNHKVYEKGSCAENKMCLVIGGGPIGLRCAVECALLGSETHLIEKRTSATRNNILHLWPFTIEDLRRLGAKKFYGQFCAGAIDHISTRQLQMILLKVCCVLGVHIHVGVEFTDLEEPADDRGWGINASPHPPPLPKFGWDVVMQASGTQHVLPLFQYKECRGQQAIGMTVNFVNRGTMEELTIEEISGIAFQFNQEFFNEMYLETGIALENIVYYKNETHYFVMSTKKHSLLSKGALKKDYPTTSELLSPDNIDYIKAQEFAREVAAFATNLPVLEFMKNHHDKADVAIFDFSAIKIAGNSAMVVERQEKKLLMCLAGDSLLEPFWPQGTGCARGFLSVLNAAWMTKKFLRGDPIYDLLRERESLFRLLPQSSSSKLSQKLDKYTIDPSTRYRVWTVTAEQYEVFHLYNKGDTPIKNPAASMTERKNLADIKQKRKPRQSRRKTVGVTATRPEITAHSTPTTPTTTMEQGVLLNWARESTCGYAGVRVSNLTTAWKSGLAFCALIHRFRPDLINFTQMSKYRPEQVLSTAFDVTAKELGIKSLFSAKELASASIPDRQKIIYYLSSLHNHFNSEESKCLQISPDMCYFCTRHITPDQLTSSHNVKFHLSCLKCEHCLDKISIHTLHYVNEKMAEEYDRMRKPEYGHLKSGFYCKFHFKEFFSPNSITLIHQSQDKEIEYIGADTPSTNTPELISDNEILSETHLDSENVDEVIVRQNSSDLRRAKSVSSVKNLRDMFENISTGSIDPEIKDEPKPQNIFKKMMNIQRKNLGVETITKSKSLYNIPRPNSQEITPEVLKSPLPQPHTPQRRTSKFDRTNSNQLSGEVKTNLSHKSSVELRISQNNPPVKYQDSTPKDRNKVSSKFSINLNNLKYDAGLSSKKKKSGIAKKIDKKNSELKKNNNNNIRDNNKFNSTASIDISSLKYSASSPCLGEDKAQHEALHDQPLHDNDEKVISLFRQYSNDALKKKSMLNFFNRKKPNFDRTTSLTISNANDPLPDPPKPEFIDVNEDSLPFERNSFSRATAPPNLSHDNTITEPDDLVDSWLCRRPSTATVSLSREAIVIRSDSPQARSLLRSSIRNSKRYSAVSKESSLVNQNMAYLDTSYTKQESPPDNSSFKEITPQSPIIGGRISIDNTSPEKVLKKSLTNENLHQAFISKTICSPRLKRPEKVKINNESSPVFKDKKDNELKPMSSTPLYCRKSLSSLTSLETAETRAVAIKTDAKMSYMRIDDSIVSKTICSPKLKRAEKCKVVSKKEDKVADVQKQRFMVDSNKLQEDIITKTICSPILKRPERVNMMPTIAKKEKPLISSSTASISSSSTSSSSGTFTTSDAFPSPGQIRKPLKWSTPQSSPLITNTDFMPDVFYTPETRTPFLLQYEKTKPTDAPSITSSLASISIHLSDTDNQISDSQTSDGSLEMMNERIAKRAPLPFMYAKSNPTDPAKPEVTSSSVKLEPRQNIAAELDEIDKNLSKLDVPDKPSKISLKRSTSNFSTPVAASPTSKYSRSMSMNSPHALSSSSPRSFSSTSPHTEEDAYTKKVLSRNSTPAEQASINQILQKYRKPQSRNANVEGTPPPLPNRNLSYNDRQKASNQQRCTRDLTRSISGDKSVTPEQSQTVVASKSGRATPRNRIKMISQLSASFDKSIDRLVNKYHNKSGTKGKTSPDLIVSNLVKMDNKTLKPKDNDYTSLKELSNLPSESTAESSSESISDHVNRSQSTRRSTTTLDSAPPKTSIPIDPSLLRYDRNSSFREKNGTPQNTSNNNLPRSRSTSNHYNSSKPPAQIERQQSVPQPRHNNNNLLYINPSPKMHNKGGNNSAYIQSSKMEKGDKSDYLKSLYYIYSSTPAISGRVENKLVFPQRKQTDV